MASQTENQEEWESKITRAKKVRRNWKAIFKVDTAILYFDGIQNPGYNKEEWITINKIYSHLMAQLPSLYANDPYFYVKLKRSFNPDPETIAAWDERGNMRAAYLNYLKTELKLKDTIRLNIQDAHFSYGIAKIFHSADSEENPTADLPTLDDEGNPLINDDGEVILDPERIPINERYNVIRIHPDDFIWDEDSGPLPYDWKWLAQRVVTDLDLAKENKQFSKEALKSLEGTSPSQDSEEKAKEKRKKGSGVPLNPESKIDDKKDTKIAYWEIYMLKGERKMHVIAEDANEPLLFDEDLPKGVEDHPYAILRFTPRDNSPYPIPPVSQAIDLNKELNMTRSKKQTHRKRFNRKYEVLVQALSDETELSKLENGEDGAIIKVQQQGAIQPIKDAPLDQQEQLEEIKITNDITEMMGGPGSARGIANADSATEASILDKRLEIKEGDKTSMVIDFTKDIARKLDMLVQAHITKDEAVRVVGPSGENFELVKTEAYEDIAGEFGYDVNVGSTIPRLPQTERASWMAFLSILGGFPQLMLSKRLLKMTAENHHIEDEAMIEELFQIGQQMMQQQAEAKGAGSQAGISEDRPVSATAGAAAGSLSLNQPGAGNLPG